MHFRYFDILATKTISYTAFYFSFQMSMPNAVLCSNCDQYSPFQTPSQMLDCILQPFSLSSVLRARGCCSSKCLQPISGRGSAAPSPLASCLLCSTPPDSTSRNSQVSNVLLLSYCLVQIRACRLPQTQNPDSLHRCTFRQRILQLHGNLKCL